MPAQNKATDMYRTSVRSAQERAQQTLDSMFEELNIQSASVMTHVTEACKVPQGDTEAAAEEQKSVLETLEADIHDLTKQFDTLSVRFDGANISKLMGEVMGSVRMLSSRMDSMAEAALLANARCEANHIATERMLNRHFGDMQECMHAFGKIISDKVRAHPKVATYDKECATTTTSQDASTSTRNVIRVHQTTSSLPSRVQTRAMDDASTETEPVIIIAVHSDNAATELSELTQITASTLLTDAQVLNQAPADAQKQRLAQAPADALNQGLAPVHANPCEQATIETSDESCWYVPGTVPADAVIVEAVSVEVLNDGAVTDDGTTNNADFWFPPVTAIGGEQAQAVTAVSNRPAVVPSSGRNDIPSAEDEVSGDSQSQSLLPIRPFKMRTVPTKRHLGISTHRRLIPESFTPIAPETQSDEVTDEGSEGNVSAPKQARRAKRCTRKPQK